MLPFFRLLLLPLLLLQRRMGHAHEAGYQGGQRGGTAVQGGLRTVRGRS